MLIDTIGQMRRLLRPLPTVRPLQLTILQAQQAGSGQWIETERFAHSLAVNYDGIMALIEFVIDQDSKDGATKVGQLRDMIADIPDACEIVPLHVKTDLTAKSEDGSPCTQPLVGQGIIARRRRACLWLEYVSQALETSEPLEGVGE